MMTYADWLSLMLIYLKLSGQIDWGWQYIVLAPLIAAFVEVKLNKTK